MKSIESGPDRSEDPVGWIEAGLSEGGVPGWDRRCRREAAQRGHAITARKKQPSTINERDGEFRVGVVTVNFIAGLFRFRASLLLGRKKRRTVVCCPPFRLWGFIWLLRDRRGERIFEEDGLSNLTLGEVFGSAGVDDGDVRNTDKAEDDAEVGAPVRYRPPWVRPSCSRCRWR